MEEYFVPGAWEHTFPERWCPQTLFTEKAVLSETANRKQIANDTEQISWS